MAITPSDFSYMQHMRVAVAEKPDCPICHNAITTEGIGHHPLQAPQVSHLFHKHCWNNYLRSSQNSLPFRCPSCRDLTKTTDQVKNELFPPTWWSSSKNRKSLFWMTLFSISYALTIDCLLKTWVFSNLTNEWGNKIIPIRITVLLCFFTIPPSILTHHLIREHNTIHSQDKRVVQRLANLWFLHGKTLDKEGKSDLAQACKVEAHFWDPDHHPVSPHRSESARTKECSDS